MIAGLTIAALVYLTILLIVAYAATHPPRSPIFLSPTVFDLEVEDVEFKSEGMTLRGWWISHPAPRAVAVLVHGYVMNRAENAALASRLHTHGFACLLFDLRACGKSDGVSAGLGWLEAKDVLAACHYSATRHPGIPRLVVGSSMGAAACAFALSQNAEAASALVLDSSYHALSAATLGWWRFIGGTPAMVLLAPTVVVGWPIAGFNPFAANVGKALMKIEKPVLIMHGTKDTLVSPGHAVKNYSCARGPKRLVWFDGASHCEARWTHTERFISEIISFLGETDALTGTDG